MDGRNNRRLRKERNNFTVITDKAFLRNALLIGDGAAEALKNKRVALFGVGGVGGFAAEALCRAGVGSITVFDNDVVEETNLNRQIISTANNIGEDKTEAVKKRLIAINPQIEVVTEKVFYLPQNADEYDLSVYDYVIDAVDTVTAKIEIICRAKAAGVPVVTCMGTGGKTDITALKIGDIEKTTVCPLAKVMRRELKKRGVVGVKAVYSTEPYTKPEATGENAGVIPSMIFVPAAAGLMLAREAVFAMLNEKNEE